jgi:tetratricopeptide (TPR) repeat protein
VYYERHNQLDEAIEVYEEALTITPNATLFQNNIAVAYYKKGNIKKALEHWKISLGIDPNQPKIEKMVNSYR